MIAAGPRGGPGVRPRTRGSCSTIPAAWGRSPPPRSGGIPLALIQRPHDTKTPAAASDAGVAPDARATPESSGDVAPAAAARHAMAAVAFPAVRRRLPHVPHHVRQARRVRSIRADWARPPATRAILVAPGLRTRRRPLPLHLRRQPIRRTRPPAQPRHIPLRLVPAHARHGMTVRLRKARVTPRIAIAVPRADPRRRRERPILPQRDLVAAHRHHAPRQHHHLRARVAVPKHVPRRPAGGAAPFDFGAAPGSPPLPPPPAQAALRQRRAAPAPRDRTRPPGRRPRGTRSATRPPSPSARLRTPLRRT